MSLNGNNQSCMTTPIIIDLNIDELRQVLCYHPCKISLGKCAVTIL